MSNNVCSSLTFAQNAKIIFLSVYNKNCRSFIRCSPNWRVRTLPNTTSGSEETVYTIQCTGNYSVQVLTGGGGGGGRVMGTKTSRCQYCLWSDNKSSSSHKVRPSPFTIPELIFPRGQGYQRDGRDATKWMCRQHCSSWYVYLNVDGGFVWSFQAFIIVPCNLILCKLVLWSSRDTTLYAELQYQLRWRT